MHALSKPLKKALVAGIITVGVTIVFFGLVWNDPLIKWQLKLTSRFYGHKTPHPEIVIVGIDDSSIDTEKGLGLYRDWELIYFAQVIENLESKGASVIALDILFSEKSNGISEEDLRNILAKNPSLEDYLLQTTEYLNDSHPSDLKFAETLGKYDNIILRKNGESDSIDSYLRGNSYPLKMYEDVAETAWTEVYPDEDDLIRRIYSQFYDADREEWDDHLSVQMARLHKSDLPEVIENSKEPLLINYAAPPYSFPMIPFVNAYNGFVTEEEVEGKIVLIGATTERLKDVFPTPTSSTIYMPGVEVHANAIQTILDESFLTEQSMRSQLLSIFGLTALLTTSGLFLGVIPGILIAAGMITAYHLSAGFWFERGLILSLVYPTLALLLAYIITLLYKTFTETRQKAQLRSAFGKYVNKDLVEKILDDPEALKLGGAKRTITVFFSDIANFTHFSEKTTPEALVSQLNDYFEVMASIIMKNGGTLNKFEGDAIMAFWGAPLDQPDHAFLAAQSALECRIALQSLHQKWQAESKPLLDFRVGLASGEVIAGNVGSKERFDYTVMGDIVNLGARLESANKTYGTHLMISNVTASLLDDAYELRRLDRLRVKGKDQSVDVYELLTAKGQLTDVQQSIVLQFHEAMEYYRNGRFEEAETRFFEVAKLAPNDGPTQTYLARCGALKQNPPQGWDGTWTLEHK